MTDAPSPDDAVNPAALGVDVLARLLTRIAGWPVSVEMIDADMSAGAPVNADGTINLVHYCAWLARESSRG